MSSALGLVPSPFRFGKVQAVAGSTHAAAHNSGRIELLERRYTLRAATWLVPGRVVLAWQIGAAWQFDPTIRSEGEVRFSRIGDNITRVDLEHRLLGTYNRAATEMPGIFSSSRGWSHIMSAFASVVVGATNK